MAQTSLLSVFVVGDSISIQYGPYLERLLEGSFHYDRKRDTSAEVATKNLDNPMGANGGDSSMVLAYLRAREEAGWPIEADYLLLNCGLHDIKTDPATGQRQVSLDGYRENLRGILAVAERAKLKVIWISSTPVPDERHAASGVGFMRYNHDLIAYNAAARAIMDEAGLPVIDLYTFSIPLVPSEIVDHVHFSDAARERQAEFITSELRTLVEEEF